jgi:hypothetical protein
MFNSVPSQACGRRGGRERRIRPRPGIVEGGEDRGILDLACDVVARRAGIARADQHAARAVR